MTTPAQGTLPSPERIFETLSAFQETAALRAAIELDVFTAIGANATTAAMMIFPAEQIAGLLGAAAGKPWKVLDIAAGHGMFGITLAKHNPQAEIVAVDWAPVLEVAKSNAQAAGVAARYRTLPGSAFDVEFGTGYDIVLLTNILHHFRAAENETLLRKVNAALKPR